MPAQLLRQLDASEVVCPAGELKGDCGVLCAIEAHVIDGRVDPSTVGALCTDDYAACTTWQAEKTRLDAGQPSFVDVAVKARRSAFEQRQVRQQRLDVARERLLSDTPAGRRLRKMMGLPENVADLGKLGERLAA
ncbi:MAG: hypothetical protein ABW167_07540 [Baekduia sp.]